MQRGGHVRLTVGVVDFDGDDHLRGIGLGGAALRLPPAPAAGVKVPTFICEDHLAFFGMLGFLHADAEEVFIWIPYSSMVNS